MFKNWKTVNLIYNNIIKTNNFFLKIINLNLSNICRFIIFFQKKLYIKKLNSIYN